MASEDASPAVALQVASGAAAEAAIRACMAAVFAETAGQKSDQFGAALWEWQYLRPEHGATVVLAEVDGVVCGYYHALRLDMRLGGRRLRGAMVQDVGTLQPYRRLGIFRALGGFALDELRARGVDFIYTFPNGRSLPSFVRNHSYSVVARVPVYVAPLDLGPLGAARLGRLGALLGRWVGRAHGALFLRPPALAAGEEVARLETPDEALSASIAGFAAARPLGLERTPSYLRWRFLDKPGGGYSLWCLRRNGEVRAHLVTRRAQLFAAPCLMLMDLGCCAGEETSLLRLIVARLRAERDEGCALGVTMGLHPFFSRISRLGFRRVPERFNPRPFNLLVRDLRGVGGQLFEPAAWHITLADWDVF